MNRQKLTTKEHVNKLAQNIVKNLNSYSVKP